MWFRRSEYLVLGIYVSLVIKNINKDLPDGRNQKDGEGASNCMG